MTREIILMRHGQPDLASVARVSPRGMQRWIAAYEQSAITDLPPPQAECCGVSKILLIHRAYGLMPISQGQHDPVGVSVAREC